MDEQGLAQHRADRKRGSSLLVPRLQFKRRHMATRLLGFKPKAFQAKGPKAKTAKTTPTKKKRRAVAKYKAGQKATGRPTRPGKGELKARQFDPRGNAPMIVTGSDCSGLDTATAALKMAGLEPCTVFLSEKDAHARKVLESNYATGGAYAVEGIGGLPHAGSKPRISTTSWQGMIPRSVRKSTSTLQAHPASHSAWLVCRMACTINVLMCCCVFCRRLRPFSP